MTPNSRLNSKDIILNYSNKIALFVALCQDSFYAILASLTHHSHARARKFKLSNRFSSPSCLESMENLSAAARKSYDMSRELVRRGANVANDMRCGMCREGESRFMIQCENCHFFVHLKCAMIDVMLKNRVEKFFCKPCRDVNEGLNNVWKNTAAARSEVFKEKHYFPVEKIVRHKETNKKRFFLIQWESYSVKDRTWEPEENMDGCLNILQSYLEKKNLPYSRVAGLMGAVESDRNLFEISNWVTMEKTLLTFAQMFSRFFKNKLPHYQEYTGGFGPTGSYFLRYEHHCYAIFWDENLKLATIGDGRNVYRKNFEVAKYINSLVNVRTRSVEWVHCSAVDHCTSAAILIQLELYRDYYADCFRKILDTPKMWRNRIIADLHAFNTAHVGFRLETRTYYCVCGRAFKLRKPYLCHRQRCGKVIEQRREIEFNKQLSLLEIGSPDEASTSRG